MYRHTLTAILCVFVLAACTAVPRYQLSKDEKGRLVRLDTRTGEIMLIDGNRLTPAQAAPAPTFKPTAEAPAPEPPHTALVDQGKAWPPITMKELGRATAALTTQWRNGQLHYRLEFYPYSKRLKLINSGYYHNAGFSLMLKDKAGQPTAGTLLSATGFKRTTNSARNGEELFAQGAIPMTKQQYESLAGWGLGWSP